MTGRRFDYFSAALVLLWSAAASAQAGGACSRTEFETAVEDSAAALRALNLENTPRFQAGLRELKDRRGWNHGQFLEQAAPLVRDDVIIAFDQKLEDLVGAINSMGQEGSARTTADCALLGELRASMAKLVETQQAKWAHMFDKLAKELAR